MCPDLKGLLQTLCVASKHGLGIDAGSCARRCPRRRGTTHTLPEARVVDALLKL